MIMSLARRLSKAFAPPRTRIANPHTPLKQIEVIAASVGARIEKDSTGYWLLDGPDSLDGNRFCSSLAELDDLVSSVALSEKAKG